MNPQQIQQGIDAINRHFRGGLNLDRDVLVSGSLCSCIFLFFFFFSSFSLQKVLELHGGDAQQTIQFLQAGEGQMVDPGPAADGLPPNYMTKPQNWAQPKAYASDVDPNSLEGKCRRLKEVIMDSETSFLQHLELMDKDFGLYLGLLLLLVEQGVELSAPAKSKILASVWARKKYDVASYLLSRPNYMFGLPEVLRAVKMLDMPRRIKQFTRKIQLLEEKGEATAKTLRVMRARVQELARDFAQAQVSAVNGSLVKRIKRWVRQIPAEHLQFFALQMPKEPWRELSDVCHFAPKDFALDWFLPVMFGQPAPQDSLLQAGNIDGANVREMVAKFKVPYSYLRKQVQNLAPEIKAMVAEYEKLTMVIWYYEELECPQVDAVLTRRLEAGEDPELPYGKLMERILYMKLSNKPFYALLLPFAERRLKSIKLPLEPPVVVFGDASYSMDVAIRVSTIIASLLTVLADADIFFFNVNSFAPPNAPSTIPQVLNVALNTKADGLTATACTLKRYYDEKKPVKFFIMVTDEIENEPSGGTFFAQLFYKYYVEVHPARLVMVSFLEDPNVKGRMVRALESFGIVPLQFRLDSKRPDLTKLDSLLGLLSAETNFFSIQANALAQSHAVGRSIEEMLAQIREGPEMFQKKLRESPGNNNNSNNNKDKEEKRSLIQEFRMKASQDVDAIPPEFVCSITGEIMDQPVVAADGHTYERDAIVAWFEKNLTSPMTNQPLQTKMVFPNHALRGAILDWIAKKTGQPKE